MWIDFNIHMVVLRPAGLRGRGERGVRRVASRRAATGLSGIPGAYLRGAYQRGSLGPSGSLHIYLHPLKMEGAAGLEGRSVDYQQVVIEQLCSR